MTGMPARTSASMIRAERTPPSTLTAWAPASRRKMPAFSIASSGRRVGQERHVGDDQRALRAADDGLRVVDHLGHRHADGRLVAEHDLAERIADEEHRDAGLVEELGGRVVVGGQHRDARAVGVQPGDVDDGQAADVACRTWRSCGLPLGLDRGPQSARRRRARPARRPRDRGAGRRPSRLRLERQVVARAVGGQDRTRGSCRCRSPDPARPRRWRRGGRRPCGGACRRPGRASRSRPRTRRGAGAGGAARLVRAPSPSRPVTRPGDPGQQVRRRLELERQPVGADELRSGGGATGRKSATAAAITRASNPADSSGHRTSSSRTAPSSAVDSTRTTVGAGRRATLDVRRR